MWIAKVVATITVFTSIAVGEDGGGIHPQEFTDVQVGVWGPTAQVLS